MSNRLADAASAYLRSAAHQPVHWHPWGPEPFERAIREDKPILLDIGAVWCHWCHVMDGESYEDPSVAEFLNQHYVCVKVDRDERPDVDGRYQRAVQGLSGQGGWPLTAFLLPSGDVFYGGTYFPPDGMHGRPGFRTVLARVAEVYRTQRDRVAQQAASLRELVAAHLDESGGGGAVPGELLDVGLLARVTERIVAATDPVFGGFGHRPKFPHPATIELLLHRWHDAGPRGDSRDAVRAAIDRTLHGMASGGIRDHLGGGFHRYSTDERWVIPHFEKMSYDNSELLRAYADAFACFGTPLYGEVAREALRWVREVLVEAGGEHRRAGVSKGEQGEAKERQGEHGGGSAGDGWGFAASQDADLGPDDDGDYFTWSLAELDQVLTPDEAKVAIARFGIGTYGRMHHDPTRNVLFLADSTAEVASRTGFGEPQVTELLASAVAKLLGARNSRPTPFVDRTRYAGWNAMMASACLRAGAVGVTGAGGPARAADRTTRDGEWADLAKWAVAHGLATLDAIRRRQPEPGLIAHGANGGAGLLEDQVQVAAAALDAFETTGDGCWLRWAIALMERAERDCWDGSGGGGGGGGGGGYFDRPAGTSDLALLGTRAKPIQDSPTPSPNGVAGIVLARLFELTRERRWAERRDRLLAAFAGRVEELGLFASTYLLAVDWAVSPVTHLVVTGERDDPTADAMHARALAVFLPRKVVIRLTPALAAEVSLPSALGGMMSSATAARGYACVGDRCLLPAETVEAWESTVTAVSKGEQR
jgi:hypothetical protein